MPHMHEIEFLTTFPSIGEKIVTTVLRNLSPTRKMRGKKEKLYLIII
jgi:hypothetical protein